jgi:hypothetical protein
VIVEESDEERGTPIRAFFVTAHSKGLTAVLCVKAHSKEVSVSKEYATLLGSAEAGLKELTDPHPLRCFCKSAQSPDSKRVVRHLRENKCTKSAQQYETTGFVICWVCDGEAR